MTPTERVRRLLEEERALTSQERWDAAAALFRDNAELVTSNYELLWDAGWTEYKLGRLSTAETYLKKAIDAKPTCHIGYWALGTVLSETDRFEDSEHNLIKALVLRDGLVGRLSLALLYMRKNMLALAEAVHKEGLRLRPNDRARIEGFADFLSDLGRDEEAGKLYESAKRLPTREERNTTRRAVKEPAPTDLGPANGAHSQLSRRPRGRKPSAT
ncbi:MAG: tetratricopeptide repeat protein [Myxococcales bacterium]